MVFTSLLFPACYFESYPCTPTTLLAKINLRKKALVTPSFSFRHCNMTLEKIDLEMYFWTPFDLEGSYSLRLFKIPFVSVSLLLGIFMCLCFSSNQ